MTTPVQDRPATRLAGWQRILLMALAGLVAAFALGVVAGLTASALEHGFTLLSVLVLAVAVLLLAALGYGVARLWSMQSQEPEAPRVRKSRNLMVICMGIGAVIGIVVAIGMIDASGSGIDIYSNGPVSAWAAATACLIWLIAVPLATLIWVRQVDEHERDAYNFGAVAGLYLYVFVTPAWWMGWRGGFLPEPEHMLTFIAVMIAWSLGWLWRRYR